MTKTLQVYFHETVIGQLVQDDDGEINFTYDKAWLNDPNAVAISCSLPLRQETFRRKECRAFFEGILPEDNQRKLIAKNLGISDKNDFSMLEKIGGECAGALSFLPVSEKLDKANETHYRELSDKEIVAIINELPKKPLLAGESGVRLSLAGVQDKLAIYVDDDRYYLPLNNAPSTHILKPPHHLYDDLIYNEYFCLTLARKIHLLAAEVKVEKIENGSFLLIKRYDRKIIENEGGKNNIIRFHQEDFCQALSIPSTKKYQNEEGPSLKQCFRLIREQSSVPVLDIDHLLNAVIFNFLIGNCDAHGKNFSLLYLDGVRLSPLYDLICTLYYDELDSKMAMKLGGEYDIHKIRPKHFDLFAEEVGLSKAELHKRLLKLSDDIIKAVPSIEMMHPAQTAIATLVTERCKRFIELMSS